MFSVSCHFTSKRNMLNLIKNTELIFISLEFSNSLLACDVNDPNKVKLLKIMHSLTSSYCLKVQMQGFFFQHAIINRISAISTFLLSITLL